MLKAVVIYVQGSSGNLIHRTLALDANTIPLLPVNLATTQYNYNINSNDRLELYNNWDYQNWNKTETEIGYWYKSGLSDFVELEQSNNQFINWAHPLEFFNDSKAGVNATVKRPDLMHSHQIPAEIKMFNKLKDKYNTSCISVNWKITQELETYLTEVNNLCVRLNLTIEEELIVKLWKSWKSNTDKIFSAYYESTK
jgi:hypothetical protein